jgi:hypothetical protein
MLNLIRHSRGAGTALVVLALSAGAVFASSAIVPVSSVNPATATATEEPTEAPEATRGPEATETPEATEKAETPDATPTATPDTHGALVSAAAHKDVPAGFRNRGEFVSCVAHSDLTLKTVDWSKFTPAFCGVDDHRGPAPLPTQAVGKGNAFGAGQAETHEPTH